MKYTFLTKNSSRYYEYLFILYILNLVEISKSSYTEGLIFNAIINFVSKMKNLTHFPEQKLTVIY